MPSDPPIDPPNEEAAAPEPPALVAEAAAPAPPAPAEAEAAAEAAPLAPVEPPAPVVPPEPVSPAKEWAVAVAIMILFAIICAQFIGFLRSNQYGGP